MTAFLRQVQFTRHWFESVPARWYRVPDLQGGERVFGAGRRFRRSGLIGIGGSCGFS